jgi:hypothetical protein
MMATVSSVAGAQGHTGSVQVTPDVITVDHATHTAKVHVINTTGDTTTAEIALQAAAPGAADSAKLDSLSRFWSLSAWITNVPKKLTLTPHETLTVALNLAVPASLEAGEYSTYLVVRTKGHGGGHIKMLPQNGSGDDEADAGADSATIGQILKQLTQSGQLQIGSGGQLQVVTSDGKKSSDTTTVEDVASQPAPAPKSAVAPVQVAVTKLVYKEGQQKKPPKSH